MKRHILVIVQIILWLVIWFIIGLNNDNFNRFIVRNWAAFTIQIVLIFAVSYFLADRWLFKKKYLTFIAVSIVLILGFAFLSAEFLMPNHQIGRVMPIGPRPPSPILVHILLISVAYFISTLLMMFMENQRKEALLEMQKTELIASELKFLKMQINPHFLFNSLNNIYALSISNSEKTPESIHSLSEMLRYVIYDCERPKVPIEKEIQYIENFIELFKLRSSKSFNISFTNDITNKSVGVAPMLFIIYIENAFKHSGLEKRGDAFVSIKLQSENDIITFCVENSVPKKRISKDESSGIGLQNAKKRLEISYPGKHKLTIETAPNFKINLKLYPNA